MKRIDDTHLELTLNGNSRPGDWKTGLADVTVIAEAGEVAGSPALLIASHGVAIQTKP
jgi:hypothetical protein